MNRPDPLTQRKEDFLRIVSHQLRTPLTSLREGISQISEGIHGEVNDVQKQFLSLCLQDVDRLTTVVENLLDISTIARGQLALKRQKVDMNEIAANVNAAFIETVEKKGLALKIELTDRTACAYADKDRVSEVFVKLIENAVEFTRTGEIVLTVESKADVIECSVRDTGEGISGDDQDKVFETFEQMVLHSLPRKKNVGLGLAIAKGIVEAHDGEIWIESKPQEGTTVSFFLPRYDIMTILAKRIGDDLDQGNKVTLMICTVEDETFLPTAAKKLNDCIRASDTVLCGKNSIFLILHSVGSDLAASVTARLNKQIEALLSKEQLSDKINPNTKVYSFPDEAETFSHLADVLSKHIDKTDRVDTGGLNMEEEKKKVLVVDDEENVSIMTTSRLRSSGFDVVSAAGGREGLRMAQRENPDLILLDVIMPDLDGYKVLAKLKGGFRTKKIPVIMFTAENRIADVTNAIEMGAEDYIIKPFTTDVLMEKIQRVLRKVEARRQKEAQEREDRR